MKKRGRESGLTRGISAGPFHGGNNSFSVGIFVVRVKHSEVNPSKQTHRLSQPLLST
jgi:hypothetical protein